MLALQSVMDVIRVMKVSGLNVRETDVVKDV